MSEVDGATLIARSLKQQGIDHLFGVVGFPITAIAAAAQKEGVAYLGMRNEQSAAYAAAAYGYLTGRPGACVVVTGPGVVHGLSGLANAQQNCWPMILIGGASETYRGGMGAFQEERQVLIASPFCKFAHGIETVHRIPYYVEMATRNAIYGRPGATYLDMPDDIIRGTCELDKVAPVERVPEPPRMVAPMENVEAALNLLERAQRPLVLLGKGMAWSRGEDEVRAFIERTQVPFVRSPMGKGVMPDDHPLSAGAARTLALQQADVIFLMGARLNWIFHFGLPPRYAKDVKVIQLDIAPEEIGHNKATEVALVGDGKAIMAQLNKALVNRQWFHPKDTPWRQALAEEGGRECRDDQAADRRRPGAGRLLPGLARRRRLDAEERDPERRGRRHHGYRPHAIAELQRPFRASTPAPTARWASASARPSPPPWRIPAGRSSTSRAIRRSAFPAWRWRRWSATTCRSRSSS